MKSPTSVPGEYLPSSPLLQPWFRSWCTSCRDSPWSHKRAKLGQLHSRQGIKVSRWQSRRPLRQLPRCRQGPSTRLRGVEPLELCTILSRRMLCMATSNGSRERDQNRQSWLSMWAVLRVVWLVTSICWRWRWSRWGRRLRRGYFLAWCRGGRIDGCECGPVPIEFGTECFWRFGNPYICGLGLSLTGRGYRPCTPCKCVASCWMDPERCLEQERDGDALEGFGGRWLLATRGMA